MGTHELIPLAKQLNRADKPKLMQSLLYDLAKEEEIALPVEEQLLLAGKSYPIWSPSTAYEAGETLLTLLKEDTGSNDRQFGKLGSTSFDSFCSSW